MVEKISKSDEEWRAQLSDLAYKVTRKHATERAFTHDDFPKGPATFHCICCGQPLFDADTKFDSGTGWPSFYKPLDGCVTASMAWRWITVPRTDGVSCCSRAGPR